MRIQCPENLRVPPPGSSVGGESGPKTRPKGVVDGKQVNIPVLSIVYIRGTKEAKFNDHWMIVEACKH